MIVERHERKLALEHSVKYRHWHLPTGGHVTIAAVPRWYRSLSGPASHETIAYAVSFCSPRGKKFTRREGRQRTLSRLSKSLRSALHGYLYVGRCDVSKQLTWSSRLEICMSDFLNHYIYYPNPIMMGKGDKAYMVQPNPRCRSYRLHNRTYKAIPSWAIGWATEMVISSAYHKHICGTRYQEAKSNHDQTRADRPNDEETQVSVEQVSTDDTKQPVGADSAACA